DHDELDDGKPGKTKHGKCREKENILRPSCCPSCVALMPVGERVCGECGHVMPVRQPVVTADGSLSEWKGKAKRTKRGVLASLPKHEIYAELMSIQIERGRSSGWLAHAYREIYGVWPRGMDLVVPRPASFAVRQFVRA